jgi:hypothetical protein
MLSDKERLIIALKSALKNAVIVFIAGLAAVYGNSEWYLVIAPLLKFVEKFLTTKQ